MHYGKNAMDSKSLILRPRGAFASRVTPSPQSAVAVNQPESDVPPAAESTSTNQVSATAGHLEAFKKVDSVVQRKRHESFAMGTELRIGLTYSATVGFPNKERGKLLVTVTQNGQKQKIDQVIMGDEALASLRHAARNFAPNSDLLRVLDGFLAGYQIPTSSLVGSEQSGSKPL